VSRDHTK
jgi:ppGpp synthetase/RelA/SpoT-type nucleotidyltranferase